MKQEIATTYYQALINRDSGFEGVFWVGVSTTGIFCRPSCPARKPKFEHCEFFASAKAALFAGFRPCKRCQPLSSAQALSPAVQQLIEAVENEPAKRWRTQDFRALAIDESTVRRQFKKRFAMTFVEYARARRMGLALQEIRSGGNVIQGQLAAG